MASTNAKTRVSKYFRLGRDQTTLDFVDVPIGNDTPVFVDPSRLRSLETTWASECTSLLQHFFEKLLDQIQSNSEAEGLEMLEGLRERNEFHLGLSRGKSQGSGFGQKFAQKMWAALTRSRASKTGLLKDLEDACLFIEGIGPDRISDATCNIIRGPLIQYTQDMCLYYGIRMSDQVQSGPVWNPLTGKWEDSLIQLPTTTFGPLLLVPKVIVRHRLAYDAHSYYTHYLLPEMQTHEKASNSALVKILSDGTKRVTKKSLRGKYGADKLAIADQSLRHLGALDRYRSEAVRTSRPITHHKLAEIENINAPRFDKLLNDVLGIPVGRDHASAYENAIEALLSALFFPSLTAPRKQDKIHDGRKRIDITYVNSAQEGFFSWLSAHYAAAHIFVECKNYGKEVGNPELDQLAGRFGASRGRIGLLVCRSVEDGPLIKRRCVDTAKDDRGYIVHITDEDLRTIVRDYVASNGMAEYPLLRARFTHLVQS